MAIDVTHCTGDVVGYGPEPDAVVAFLKAHSITCVRGNHDRWAPSEGKVCRSLLQHDPSATLDFLNTVPPVRILEAKSKMLVITHGVPGSDMTYLTNAISPKVSCESC